MDLDLSPKLAQKIFEGEGGSYYGWSSSEFPVLGATNVGAGRLVLEQRGFALPHFADTSKVGYVLQGTEGIAGMVLPNSSKELVLKLKKGDIVPVPMGTVSWWYNNGDSKFVMVFLGETATSYVPGEFTYFLLTGGVGILPGFSTDFISRACNLNETEATKLAKSQNGVLIIKLELESNQTMPQPFLDLVHKMVYNIDAASPDVEIKSGGTYKNLTAENFGFLGEAGLSVNHVKLEANAMHSPTYVVNATKIVYVDKGSGRVQIVGINGKRVLDTKVEAGQLFVVPRLFVVALVAGDEGIECFSVISAARPLFADLVAGKNSVWNALSPIASQFALGVTSEFEQLFKSHVEKSTIILPPPNPK